VEQQGRLSGSEPHRLHKPGLSPKQPQPLGTGAASGRQLLESVIAELGQSLPVAHPSRRQCPLLMAEVGWQLPAALA